MINICLSLTINFGKTDLLKTVKRNKKKVPRSIKKKKTNQVLSLIINKRELKIDISELMTFILRMSMLYCFDKYFLLTYKVRNDVWHSTVKE